MQMLVDVSEPEAIPGAMYDRLHVCYLSTACIALAVHGDLDFFTYPILAKVLDRLTSVNPLNVDLDFSRVELMDASAARWLYQKNQRLACSGGRLIIWHAQPLVRKVLNILKMETLAAPL